MVDISSHTILTDAYEIHFQVLKINKSEGWIDFDCAIASPICDKFSAYTSSRFSMSIHDLTRLQEYLYFIVNTPDDEDSFEGKSVIFVPLEYDISMEIRVIGDGVFTINLMLIFSLSPTRSYFGIESKVSGRALIAFRKYLSYLCDTHLGKPTRYKIHET